MKTVDTHRADENGKDKWKNILKVLLLILGSPYSLKNEHG